MKRLLTLTASAATAAMLSAALPAATPWHRPADFDRHQSTILTTEMTAFDPAFGGSAVQRTSLPSGKIEEMRRACRERKYSPQRTEGLYTLTVTVPVPQEGWKGCEFFMPDMMAFALHAEPGGDPEPLFGFDISDDEDVQVFFFDEVPAGTYDFETNAWALGVARVDLVAEDIVINSDTELTLTYDDCTRLISFDAVLPDGSLPMNVYRDDNDNVIHAGNVEDSRLSTHLHHRVARGLCSYNLGFDATNTTGERIDRAVNGNILTSAVNSISYGQFRYYEWEGGNVILSWCSEAGTPVSFKTGKNHYTLYEPEFAGVPNSYEGDDALLTREAGTIMAMKEIGFGNSIGSSTHSKWDAAAINDDSRCYVANSSPGKIKAFPIIASKALTIGRRNGDSVETVGIMGIDAPMADVSADGIRWLSYQEGHGGYNYPSRYEYLPMDFAFPWRWPYKEHPFWTVGEGQYAGAFGSTAPSTVFLTSGNGFWWESIGTRGELRTVDFVNTSIDIKRGTTALADSFASFIELQENNAELSKKGNWAVTLDNTNPVVDGLAGRNLTQVAWKGGENVALPTVMRYTCYDTDADLCTNRFATPQGALMTMSAGVFDYRYGQNLEQGYCFEYPESVKVEYSPYGTDAWQPLPVEEKADFFFMPGYGAFYVTDLGGVDRNSTNGWFDLRISLTAPGGASQTQVISPAFNMASQVGVPDLGAEGLGVKVNGRDIQTPAGSRIYDASGCRCQGQGVVPGIYLVATPGGTAKVAVM